MKKIVVISDKKYAIIKSKKVLEGAFANIIDNKEITSIILQDEANLRDVIKIQKNYRLITFDMILPFNLVGFIAQISNELAKEKIPLFVISAYSTDHILIQDRYIEKAKNKLKKLGFE